ncbi:MAG: PQQ-dependent sugar dehydrogenase [Eubacteriales bacterium]|nr:PQQ-dependent sugar dehydrogenase [Eubacteriales bacterium]
MKKVWIILIILLFSIIIFWQMGGIDYLAARTVFAPDHTTDLVDEEKAIIFSKDIEYEVESIGEGLEIPWEIAPLPEGRFFVTERPGRVVLLGSGEIYTVEGVEHVGEGGLLGMEISPNFQEDAHVFLYYTYRSGNQIFNRLSRFTFAEDTLINEEYILNEIPGSRFHNGGRVKFGPDGKLYVTTGDAQNPNLSQNINSLAGKILRINSDGTIPEDNPFENNPVFAYGLRNPQGLSWHPVTGELFASDHGPNSQDEINRILPGMNYGWPIVSCKTGESQYEDPIVCYSDFTMAPSGIVFLPWDNIDETPLYVTGLRGNMVMRVDLDDEGNFIRQEPVISEYGRIRTIVYQKDSLYLATNNRDGRGVPNENDDVILRINIIKEEKSERKDYN